MEYVKVIMKTVIYVLCGIVICSAIFISFLYPSAELDVFFLWQMIMIAVLCSLGDILYFSKTELSKKQMKIRKSIHYLYCNLVVLGGAILFGWINAKVILQVIFMIILIAVVYIGVSITMFQKAEKVAENMNRKLSKIHNEEDTEEL